MVGLPMHIITGPGPGAGGGDSGTIHAFTPGSHASPSSHAQLTAGLMTVTIVIGAITNATNDAVHTLLNPHRRVRRSSMIHRPRG
jgi:hypothetical protein